MSTTGGPSFAFSLPAGRFAPWPPRQLRHCIWILELYWQNQTEKKWSELNCCTHSMELH